MLAGIEAGGTKMVCSVSDYDLNLKGSVILPATTPEETIGEMVSYFKKFDYGHIMRTPKPGWSGIDVVGAFKSEFNVPVGFDTDVNAAVLGEVYKGAARGCDNDRVWELEAYYIAQAITDYVLAYSPEKIILWGGVMHQDKLFDMVRAQVKNMLGGYVQSDMIEKNIDQYIVKPGLGEKPGIIGALCLAKLALDSANRTN